MLEPPAIGCIRPLTAGVRNTSPLLINIGQVRRISSADELFPLEYLLHKVDEFLPFLPVITGLRTAGMRDRHWDLLSEKLGVDLHPDDSYTLTMYVGQGFQKVVEAPLIHTILATILKYGEPSKPPHTRVSTPTPCKIPVGVTLTFSSPLNESNQTNERHRVIEQELHKNAAVITKVSETASKEFAIESALDKMQGAWASVKLNTEEYRETGPFGVRTGWWASMVDFTELNTDVFG